MTSGSRLEAVLFDMDGLLVDSEPEWFEVEAMVFARLGADRAWTPSDAHALTGQALEASAARIARLSGSTVPATVVAGWMVESMAERLARGVPFKPGALELMGVLGRSGVRVAVVSSSYRQLVDTVLGQIPAGLVQTTVAGNEVRRGKPHPDPYLQALAGLRVAAGNAVVVEDSPTGATAGAAAGCAVLVVPDVAPLPSEHPWEVVASLADVDVDRLVELLGRDRGEDVEVGGSTSGDDRGEHTDEGRHHEHDDDQGPRHAELGDAVVGERLLDRHTEQQPQPDA